MIQALFSKAKAVDEQGQDQGQGQKSQGQGQGQGLNSQGQDQGQGLNFSALRPDQGQGQGQDLTSLDASPANTNSQMRIFRIDIFICNLFPMVIEPMQ